MHHCENFSKIWQNKLDTTIHIVQKWQKVFTSKVAQSARIGDGGQDDYLGGVDIPVRDLPPQGLDRWYKLEGI